MREVLHVGAFSACVWQPDKHDAIYCPKDGSTFEIIEVGSTGIFRAHYHGEWPTGGWLAEDGGDLWPSHPCLFRLLPEAQAEYDAKKKAAAERYRAELLSEEQR